ncbi:HCAR2 protein, partial [Amia calva]|nr:HCAR2 protein [Amia calva]
MRNENWVFGDVMCRMNLFMLATNRSASIAFMTTVALDRYFKVVHPHHPVNHLSARRAVVLAVSIWALVFSLRTPLLANKLLNQHNNSSLCRSFSSYSKPTLGIRLHYALYIGEFFLPFFLLLFCTLRTTCILRSRQLDKEKKVRRAIKVIRVIVGVFTVCFLPGILTGIITLLIQKFRPKDCISYSISAELFSIAVGFTYLNSALDPVIYCFSSPMFNKALKTAVNSLGLCHLDVSRRGSVATSDEWHKDSGRV